MRAQHVAHRYALPAEQLAEQIVLAGARSALLLQDLERHAAGRIAVGQIAHALEQGDPGSHRVAASRPLFERSPDRIVAHSRSSPCIASANGQLASDPTGRRARLSTQVALSVAPPRPGPRIAPRPQAY